jgi:hypothetical protein
MLHFFGLFFYSTRNYFMRRTLSEYYLVVAMYRFKDRTYSKLGRAKWGRKS